MPSSFAGHNAETNVRHALCSLFVVNEHLHDEMSACSALNPRPPVGGDESGQSLAQHHTCRHVLGRRRRGEEFPTSGGSTLRMASLERASFPEAAKSASALGMAWTVSPLCTLTHPCPEGSKLTRDIATRSRLG
jgi:hypothetical protein